MLATLTLAAALAVALAGRPGDPVRPPHPDPEAGHGPRAGRGDLDPGRDRGLPRGARGGGARPGARRRVREERGGTAPAGPRPGQPGAPRAARGGPGAAARARRPARPVARRGRPPRARAPGRSCWLVHAVHGNEISSPDAALALAHHLLAAQDDPGADLVRREAIVLIDPLQNPDGRARFLASNALGRAARPDAEPASAEHDEPWPGGRGNHYLFDMNRDWFAQAQPETRGRLRFFLDWYPHVAVDLHEMGGDSTYYFAPPARPLNPYFSRAQQDWLDSFGRAIAARFDAAGEAYFVREVFDSFYPGYGESWPMGHGAVGMTFEQASARGLVWRREDGTSLTYLRRHPQPLPGRPGDGRDRGPGTGEAAAGLPRVPPRRGARRRAGAGAPVRARAGPGPRSRAARWPTSCSRRGSRCDASRRRRGRASASFPRARSSCPSRSPRGGSRGTCSTPGVSMDEAFVKEQERRRKKRLDYEIYDVTGWSLPLAFDVECVALAAALGGEERPYAPVPASAAAPSAAKVAWLLPWGTATAATVAEALQDGLKVRVAEAASGSPAGRGPREPRSCGWPRTLPTRASGSPGSRARTAPRSRRPTPATSRKASRWGAGACGSWRSRASCSRGTARRPASPRAGPGGCSSAAMASRSRRCGSPP